MRGSAQTHLLSGRDRCIPALSLPMLGGGWSEDVASWESSGCLKLASPPCRSLAVHRRSGAFGGTDLGVTKHPLRALFNALDAGY